MNRLNRGGLVRSILSLFALKSGQSVSGGIIRDWTVKVEVEVEVCHRSSQSRSCLYMFRFSTIADMVVPGAQCLVLLQSKT